ncbi:MAG: PadR family transcriptional regulator [Enterococcus sp.]
MYDLLILGSLVTGEKSGYKLQKIVGAALQPRRKVSSGVLYPALMKLKSDGLIKVTVQEEGRKQKIWHLTETGYQQFLKLMSEKVPSDAKRYDILNFKMRSLDGVSLSIQRAILLEFKEYVEEDLTFYLEKQKEMHTHIPRFPENQARFEILIDALELDIQLAKTKLAWLNQQLAKREVSN